MSMKKPLGLSLLIGLLALSFAALPAFASAATVTLRAGSKTGAALANGTAVKAFSSNLKFGSAESGFLECAENTLTGTVKNNGTATTSIEITAATFLAAGGTKDCKTSIPNGMGGNFTATITPKNLPWTDDMFSNGTDSLISISGKPIEFEAKLDIGTTVAASCTYKRTAVATTFAFNVALEEEVAATQTFALVSGAGCPSSGTLTGKFLVTTAAGGTIVATTP